jgi:hypothetical protein
VIANCAGNGIGINVVLTCAGRLDDLQVAPREQEARGRDVAGVAAELYAVGRRAQSRRTDTFTSG